MVPHLNGYSQLLHKWDDGPTRTMTKSQPRTREVRVNDSDLAALKAARDSIDSSLALGAVARMGARELLKQTDSEDIQI